VVAEAEREIGGPVEGLAERLVEIRAVIEEAVRLYPPLPAISRAAIAADDLSRCRIKPGSTVVIAPHVLHRHRLLWERPDEFDPNRFLGTARTALDRFAYLPFGVGPRIRIGSGFALQEATLVVATVMKHFRLASVPGRRVWPVLRVTLRPNCGLPMVVRRRNAAHRLKRGPINPETPGLGPRQRARGAAPCGRLRRPAQAA
jgi:cytochrome P450